MGRVITIEQLQFTGDESTSTTNTKIKLNFNHPTKELVWVVQPDAHVTNSVKYGSQWFNYTDDLDQTFTTASAYSGEDAYGPTGGVVAPSAGEDLENLAGGMPGVAAGGANRVFLPTSFEGGDNPVARAKIQLNGHDRFAEMDGRYFNLVQPFQHHENVPSRGINVYSFGLKPEEHQPSGTCNFSRIDSATLNITLTPQTVTGGRTAKVRVYAVNSAANSVKLVLISPISATFPNCGNVLRYLPNSMLNCVDLDNPQPSLYYRKVQRLNGSGHSHKCLRYSPTGCINITIKLQLQCAKNYEWHGRSRILQLVREHPCEFCRIWCFSLIFLVTYFHTIDNTQCMKGVITIYTPFAYQPPT